jgi:membrane-associated PAP2 superfamily phosphatase
VIPLYGTRALGFLNLQHVLDMRSYQQLAYYLSIPLIVILFAVASEYSGLDLRLESGFYDATTGTWPYKSLFITSDVLHTWARYFVLFCALVNLAGIIASFFSEALVPWRKHLMFIFVAGVAGPLLVGLLKNSTHIFTPWDLQFFGGDKPYIRIFDSVYTGASIGHAFPGGHSSGGFAYVSTFFALSAMGSKYRYHGLVIPLLMGMLFAATQEIRGAHFLSHDLFSFAICWLVSLMLAVIFYPEFWNPREAR